MCGTKLTFPSATLLSQRLVVSQMLSADLQAGSILRMSIPSVQLGCCSCLPYRVLLDTVRPPILILGKIALTS